MKAEEILPLDQIDEKDQHSCSLCLLHEKAQEKIPEGIECPYCGHSHDVFMASIEGVDADLLVVGETNVYRPAEKIVKLIVFNCAGCGEHIGLNPIKINYNANHDVYYTGGGEYLNDDDDHEIFLALEKRMKPHLDNFAERILAGEKLSTDNVALWLKRDVTHSIAEYLYTKGLKT